MDGCKFVDVEICEYWALVVLHPFTVYQCSSFEGISIEESIDESGYLRATMEEDALCLVLQESRGILYRVVAVVCP
jgi:hypothetical protein